MLMLTPHMLAPLGLQGGACLTPPLTHSALQVSICLVWHICQNYKRDAFTMIYSCMYSTVDLLSPNG